MSAENNDARPIATTLEQDTAAAAPDPRPIQKLNDRLRKTGAGGQVLITDGILQLGLGISQKVLEQVAGFDQFTPDNDPWGEHDCASLEVEGQKVIWKIDYYDKRMEFLSPDPADPKVTCRVLTIMLASEY